MDSLSSSSSLPVQTTNPSDVPSLSFLVPLASQAFAALKSSATFSFRVFQWLFSTITYPVLLLTPLYYVFAPAIVFVQVSLDFLVFTPYKITAYLLDLVYPIYVVVGAACIAGVLLGGLGRIATFRLTDAVYPPAERRKRVKTKSG